MPGAPAGARVALFDSPALESLALSRTLLVSVGTLADLKDEAELAFVLGHELAHASAVVAGERLARLAFRAMARQSDAPGAAVWAGAAVDLMRLGCGLDAERDADARALEALLALRYDPASALRYLDRLGRRVDAGDRELDVLSSAHPAPADRRRRLERILAAQPGTDPQARVNRELFRRAAGDAVLSGALEPVDGIEDPASVEGSGSRSGWMTLLWTGLGIALLAALFLVAGILLSR